MFAQVCALTLTPSQRLIFRKRSLCWNKHNMGKLYERWIRLQYFEDIFLTHYHRFSLHNAIPMVFIFVLVRSLPPFHHWLIKSLVCTWFVVLLICLDTVYHIYLFVFVSLQSLIYYRVVLSYHQVLVVSYEFVYPVFDSFCASILCYRLSAFDIAYLRSKPC